MDYQLAVIGAGPGGYVAAIRAAQLGMKVVLVEKERPGGICLNKGCIPTKTLVASAQLYRQVMRAGEYGISVTGTGVDWPKVIDRKEAVVGKLVKGIEFLLKKNKVDLLPGIGALEDHNTVGVISKDGARRTITADTVILATGSQPLIPSFCGHNGRNVVTAEEALDLRNLPSHVVIVGGGVIGCEFASIYRSMGVDVTIIELLPQILSQFEPELSRQLATALKKNGVKIMTATAVREIKQEEGRPCVILGEDEEILTDLVLVSIGRRPELSGLGLEKLGVKVSAEGRVKVDECLHTNLSWLYAVGDMNDLPYDLAHAASAQAITAVEHIAGGDKKWEERVIPNCVFTFPEVAAVGLTRKEAEEKGYRIKTGRFPFLACGKAMAAGETEGFVLTVAEEESQRLLGVHMVGPHVTELIAEATLAVQKGLTAGDLAYTVHAHPTLAEAVMESAEAVFGKAIHSG